MELWLSVRIQIWLESVLLRMNLYPTSIAVNSLLRTEQFSGMHLESFLMKAPLPVQFYLSLLPSVYINMASLGIPFMTYRANCRRHSGASEFLFVWDRNSAWKRTPGKLPTGLTQGLRDVAQLIGKLSSF
ncbi:hypothetical protein TNCV_3135451 [Trichonephila clavipes]|nr:hypothetical protein TNCV_3135451 [Trichonephila clavipes]